MATRSLSNPFADFGGIVHGDRFVGREKALSIVEQRVLGKAYGNLAIVGLPRVGKSSLAWQAIMEKRRKLIHHKTIPIFFEAGHYSSSEEFFRQMVDNSYKEMAKTRRCRSFQKLSLPCVESLQHEFDKNLVAQYFKIVAMRGYKTIFIIDEFDRVRNIFDTSDFQLLRELSYNPDTHLCLVTCSRKTIKDIEVRDGAISNFSGIFSELNLSMFSQEDVDIYWKHFLKGSEPAQSYREQIAFYTGGYPYLMDLINDRVFKAYNGLPTSDENVDYDFDSINLEVMEALDKIVHTLSEENLLNDALQLIIGPMYDVGQKQIEKLLKYGVIRRVNPQYKKDIFEGIEIGPSWGDYAYTCFSDYSTLDLYRRYYADVPYLPIWSETENLLRGVVKDFLKLNFPFDWESSFRQYLVDTPPYKEYSIQRWDENFASLKLNRDKMVAKFPNMRDMHLVDFTLTAQIFDIFIRPASQWFNNHIFLGVWQDWNNKFSFLSKVRNPVAHNNVSQNIESDINVAKAYCADVTKAIRDWQKLSAQKSD